MLFHHYLHEEYILSIVIKYMILVEYLFKWLLEFFTYQDYISSIIPLKLTPFDNLDPNSRATLLLALLTVYVRAHVKQVRGVKHDSVSPLSLRHIDLPVPALHKWVQDYCYQGHHWLVGRA